MAGGQRRVVREDGPCADDDRVARRPQLVHVGPGRLPGDPPARPVGGRGPPVEGRRHLPGHQGAAVDEGRRPGPVEGLGLDGEETADDVHANRAQQVGSSPGPRVGVGLGEDDPGDAGSEEGSGAGSGQPGVRAGLQRHVCRGARGCLTGLRERDDLGMRRSCACVEAGSHRQPRGIDDDGADARVHVSKGTARGELEGSGHGRDIALVVCEAAPHDPHPSCLSLWRAPG